MVESVPAVTEVAGFSDANAHFPLIENQPRKTAWCTEVDGSTEADCSNEVDCSSEFSGRFHAKDMDFPALSRSSADCPWKCFSNQLWDCILTDYMIWKLLPKLLLYVGEFNLFCLGPFFWRFTEHFLWPKLNQIYECNFYAFIISICNPPFNLWILRCHSDVHAVIATWTHGAW